MNKELLFAEIKEKVTRTSYFYSDDRVKFIVVENDLCLTMKGKEDTIQKIIYTLYEDEEGKHIDKRTAKNLLNEFIEVNSYPKIRKEIVKILEEMKQKSESEEQNKYKLNNIIPELEKLELFTRNKIEVKYWSGDMQYVIEFDCRRDKHTSENVQIYNNHINDKYEVKISYEVIGLYNKEELTILIDELYNRYLPYHEILKKQKEAEEREQQKQLELTKKVFEVRNNLNFNKKIYFRTGKDKYTVIEGNTKYTYGKGCSGKFYNCSYSALEKLVKNNKGYFVAEAEARYTLEELSKKEYIRV